MFKVLLTSCLLAVLVVACTKKEDSASQGSDSSMQQMDSSHEGEDMSAAGHDAQEDMATEQESDMDDSSEAEQ